MHELDDPGHQKCGLMPIMVLMHVSRQFRLVMLHSYIWRPFGFDFRRLIHVPDYPFTGDEVHDPDPPNPHAVNRLIKALFLDPHVVECLSRKTDWAFPPSCPELILAATGLPSFPETVRKLWICGDFNLVLDRLNQCSNVTELGILDNPPGRWIRSVDMAKIMRAFPNLQHLYLGVRVFNTALSPRNLLSYEVLVLSKLSQTTHFLPLQSASTLTTLGIFGQELDIGPMSSLTHFIALRHLKLSARNGVLEVNRVLRAVSTKLMSLELQVFTDKEAQEENEEWKSLSFHHPCLSNLESITIEGCRNLWDPGAYYDFFHRYRCSILLEAIAEGLLGIQNVTLLYGALDTSHTQCLRHLRNLRSFTCVLKATSDCVGENLQLDYDPSGAVARIFEERDSKPRIMIGTERDLGLSPQRADPTRWPYLSAWYDRLNSRWPLHIDPFPVE
jgi:hypothetical protein